MIMELANILHQYRQPFMRKYGDFLSPNQIKAFKNILECRTVESGEVAVSCPRCSHIEWKPLSCGNRNCPKCQNHNASQWIDRQMDKLLPGALLHDHIYFTAPVSVIGKAFPRNKFTLCSFYALPEFSRISD